MIDLQNHYYAPFPKFSIPSNQPSLPPRDPLIPTTSSMVVAENLGPLAPILLTLSQTIHTILISAGLPAPSLTVLPDAVLFSILTLLLSLLLPPLLSSLSARSARDSVLILGISGEADQPAVGKTTLFHVLRYGHAPKLGTVPSQAPTVAVFTPSQTSHLPSLRWVDFPGHARLRHLLPEQLPRARAIIFVIDATRFATQARRDAALLYDILTSPSVARDATPVLIWLNRHASIAQSVVRARLEAELQRARAAGDGGLRAADVVGDDADAREEDANRVPLGFDNEAFSFDHAPGPVIFGAGCAVSAEVDDVLAFVREYAK